MEGLRHNSLLQHEVEPEHEVEFGVAGSAPIDNLNLLWEHRRLLFRVLAWSLAISTVVAFLIPRRYESTVSIVPPDSLSGSNAMMAAVAAKADPNMATMAGNVLGMKSNGAYFTALLSSRSVQDHVIERFGLQKVYSTRYVQDARKKLASRTAVSEDRKSGIITLEVADGDPKRARDMAQAYVDELNHLVADVSTSSAHRERIFIEQRIASVKQDLGDAEKQFSVFASRNATLDIKEQSKAMMLSAAALQGQMIAAQSEVQGLEQIYTPSNIRVRAARARIDELQRELRKIGGSDTALDADNVKDKNKELYPSIRELPLLGVEWADLYRRMKIQETVYELLNQQYELARIQEAKEIPTVNVVDPADLPERKSWPPRMLVILALTCLSVMGAGVWILGATRWERVDPEDPHKQLLATIVGSIRVQLRNMKKHRTFKRVRAIMTRSKPQPE
jgi:capsule polysaccharide export protein KpsE/RkpR